MKTINLLLFSLILTGLLKAQELQKAQVTLPYKDIRALIETAERTKNQQTTSPPPIAAILQSAHYQLSISENPITQGKVDFSVTSLNDQWQLIPLLDTNLIVKSISPADYTLVSKDNMLCLLTNKTGQSDISIKFLTKETKGNSITFQSAKATTSTITIDNKTTSKQINIEGGLLGSEHPNLYYLSPDGGEITLQKTEIQTNRLSPWKIQSQILTTAKGAELLSEAHIHFLTNEQNPGNMAVFHLPRYAHISSITGSNLQNWSLKTGDTKGDQNISLQWKNSNIASRRITLKYSVPLPDFKETWDIPIPTTEHTKKPQAFLCIINPKDIEFSAIKDTQEITSEQIPDWINQTIKDLDNICLSITSGAKASINTKRVTRLKTEQATIHQGVYSTRIESGGDSLTEASLTIEHRAPTHWEFTLPEGATLLSCAVNEQLTDPISRERSILEIPLSRNNGKSVITFSYTSKKEKFNPIEGKTALTLPTTALFINELNWFITLPQNYEATALEGNVEILGNKKSGEPISLQKRLCRGDTPNANIFYRKGSLEN